MRAKLFCALAALCLLATGCQVLTAPIGWAASAWWVAHDGGIEPPTAKGTNNFQQAKP